MKDKSRGPEKPSDESASSEGTSSESAAAESASSQASAGDTKPRASLPAFGFAADLLKKSRAADTEATLATPAAPSELGDLSDAAQDLDPQAPSRVFDFADQLEVGTRQSAEQAAPIRLGTFVTFELASERFAIPVDPVRQVVRVSAITRVPHAPRPIRGVTNLRGRVIPVIDLRLRIGLPETTIERTTRVISVASKGRLIGLLVDAVHQVMHLDLNKVQPPPDDVMTVQSDYIEGVYGEGSDLLMLLDIDRALIIKDAA